MLKKLTVAFPKAVGSDVDGDMGESGMSGIEFDSPHKEMANAHEFPFNVPEIGNIHTLWVGQKGVCDIRSMVVQQEAEKKSSEIRTLARECLRAFEAAGCNNSDNEQVVKAINLCQSYSPNFVSSRHLHKTNAGEIAELWKEQPSVNVERGNQTAQSLAKSVLGRNLVDKLTNKTRQPPDVSLCGCMQMRSVPNTRQIFH